MVLKTGSSRGLSEVFIWIEIPQFDLNYSLIVDNSTRNQIVIREGENEEASSGTSTSPSRELVSTFIKTTIPRLSLQIFCPLGLFRST